MKKEEQDHVWVQDESIYYRSDDAVMSVPLNEVKLVGEMTTNDGPGLDYYLIVAREMSEWFEFPMTLELFYGIERYLGVRLESRLYYKTEFAHVVLWPPELAGQELFCVREEKPKRWTFWEWVAGTVILYREFTPEITSFFSEVSGDAQ